MIFILSICCNFLLLIYSIVHCRTGSLEKYVVFATVSRIVHCRTGSLEINSRIGQSVSVFTAVQAA